MSQPKKRVLILLAGGFEVYEAAAFIDVMGWAATYGSEPIEAVTAGLRNRLHCTFGPDMIPDATVDQLDFGTFDALAIPGGFEKAGFYEDAYAPEYLDVIRAFDASSKPIASICVGALPIAKTGILSDRQATTYHLANGKRREQLADLGADVQDRFVVKDRNITTSACPATAMDVAFDLLEELTSCENANGIRALMGFEAK